MCMILKNSTAINVLECYKDEVKDEAWGFFLQSSGPMVSTPILECFVHMFSVAPALSETAFSAFKLVSSLSPLM